ncbi:hypothetical protein LJC48_06700 [Desulfovibrio sp. OttesenSCG-928-C06]|nr:hypothetical protein [Desulfovibrio sp. OttesenSCG-928-C06]
MKKVITSDDINRARKSGQSCITLASGDLITPQARDDAKGYGITIMQADGADSMQPRPAAQTDGATGAVADWPAAMLKAAALARQAAASASGPAERFQASSERARADERHRAAEQAVRRISARMGLERRNPGTPAKELPMSQNTLPPCALQAPAAPAATQTGHGQCDRQPDIETEKLVSVIMEVISEFYPNYRGHLSRLQAQTEPGTVRICESSAGGIPFCLLSWDGKPLEWLFETPERIAVVDGRLSVQTGSGAFALAAGECRDMPAGTRVTLVGEGAVSCKLVSCA